MLAARWLESLPMVPTGNEAYCLCRLTIAKKQFIIVITHPYHSRRKRQHQGTARTHKLSTSNYNKQILSIINHIPNPLFLRYKYGAPVWIRLPEKQLESRAENMGKLLQVMGKQLPQAKH